MLFPRNSLELFGLECQHQPRCAASTPRLVQVPKLSYYYYTTCGSGTTSQKSFCAANLPQHMWHVSGVSSTPLAMLDCLDSQTNGLPCNRNTSIHMCVMFQLRQSGLEIVMVGQIVIVISIQDSTSSRLLGAAFQMLPSMSCRSNSSISISSSSSSKKVWGLHQPRCTDDRSHDLLFLVQGKQQKQCFSGGHVLESLPCKQVFPR
jgi:hypothetical protein